MTPVACK